MFRIRFHGRGGQGIKTASRILGTSFFLSGYEVQDAPRYGAERRGAPIFAYVRADTKPIDERGPIQDPDLVVVVDETLVGVPAAGVLAGLRDDTVLLVDTRESVATWKSRIAFAGTLLVLHEEATDAAASRQYAAVACCGGAARLCGVIEKDTLADAVRTELAGYPDAEIDRNVRIALAAYDSTADRHGLVASPATEAATDIPAPGWVDVPVDAADAAAPAIRAPLTSVLVRTGLWRTMRPVIDYDRCRHCWWVCSTFCPDDAISVDDDNRPVIDYDHCKGCMICVAQCPPHAIGAIPETEAIAAEKREPEGRKQEASS